MNYEYTWDIVFEDDTPEKAETSLWLVTDLIADSKASWMRMNTTTLLKLRKAFNRIHWSGKKNFISNILDHRVTVGDAMEDDEIIAFIATEVKDGQQVIKTRTLVRLNEPLPVIEFKLGA